MGFSPQGGFTSRVSESRPWESERLGLGEECGRLLPQTIPPPSLGKRLEGWGTRIFRCSRRFSSHVPEARYGAPGGRGGEAGYVLLAVLVLMFLMLLVLTIAAPTVAMQLKHDQEIETEHRANQYVRAIRLFHKKTGNYPTSIEQLEKTNNQRYLRQRYLDPLTGKDDWKLIMVGQNKTTVKGFFGKDLPGLGGGLGAAAGMQSNMGTPTTTGSSSFGSNAGSAFGTGSPGQSGATLGANGTGTGSSGAAGGIQSTDATQVKGSNGPIMGVGVSKEGEAFLSVNGASTYQDWEFIYDPRIEQMYAKSAALGGAGGSGGSGTGLTPVGTGTGTNGGNPFGSGTFGGGNTPPPPVTPPVQASPQ
jgi:type II secretory pathway pseudopilin PulG